MQSVLDIAADVKPKFTIQNHSGASLRVGIEVFERVQKKGSEQRVATSDLKFEKNQYEVPAGESLLITGEYRGRADFKHERSFRILTKQLSPSASSDRFVFSYEASLFARSGNMSSDVRARFLAQPNAKTLEVELDNRGTAHQPLSTLSFFVDGLSEPLKFDAETVDRLGKQVLLPQAKRKVKLTLEASSKALELASARTIAVRLIP